MKQVFGLMDCFNIKNYCHKKYSHNRRICWICENDFCVCVPCEWENNLRGENIPTSKLMWQNPQTDSKWTKHWKTKCCENANQSNKVGGWAGVGRVQLRHLKKIPHGFGLLKYFTLSFFFKKIWKHLKNMQIVWKSCMANSDSLQASFRCLSRIIKKPLPTRLHKVEEVFPILSILH